MARAIRRIANKTPNTAIISNVGIGFWSRSKMRATNAVTVAKPHARMVALKTDHKTGYCLLSRTTFSRSEPLTAKTIDAAVIMNPRREPKTDAAVP